MSFILEAQKREAANIDPAVAAQLAVDAHRASRWRWIWLGIGVAVLANALIIGYFLNPFGKDASSRSASEVLSAPNSGRELVVRPRERTGPTRAEPQDAARRSATERTAAARRPDPGAASANTTTSNIENDAAAAAADAASNGGLGRVLSPEQAAQLNIALPDEPAQAAVPAPAFESADSLVEANSPEPTQSAAEQTRPATKAEGDGPITLADLSPADRAAFPKLEFSTHIFADDPALRAVVVNSKRLAEGESIGEMVLRAVTEDGILVDYRGHQVAVSVVETWN